MDSQKSKQRLLAAILLITFVVGVIFSFLDADSSAFTLCNALFLVIVDVLILRWFILDAAEHNYPLPKFAYLQFFFFLVIMAPIYFFETRKKGAWRSILLSLVFVALLAGAMVGGLYAGTALAPSATRGP